ncbi:nucleoside-diphosphate-sugar epimerase [Diaporthe helianthi]|uniref:Nucleoside-diphosphate-sugar epimerase n=1 Tax=Diaporthe helianthi TaxID=158607 RepID=A0A2P5HVA6_DIAHE|nr:nucleoside-diphosphate-sugar epimerase [Diaporthe helianthi]
MARHLILTGGTGLVGSSVLDAMLKTKEVTKISVLSRRPVKMAEDAKDPRVNVIIHEDFEHYGPDLMSKLSDADGCVWALGISQTQVSKEEYVKITKDYALRAAEAFRTLGTPDRPFTFVYVSGEGATLTPGRFTPIFGRVKGETEKALAEMRAAAAAGSSNSFLACAVRPAFVDAAQHGDIAAYVPATQGLAKTAMLAALSPPIRAFYKSAWSPTLPLGRFMTEVAMGRWEAQMQAGGLGVEKIGEFPIVSNVGFRRLAGLDGGQK